jgi:hypothetical protein
MVTYRWWGSKFCKRRCKEAYLREVALGRDKLVRRSAFGAMRENFVSLLSKQSAARAPSPPARDTRTDRSVARRAHHHDALADRGRHSGESEQHSRRVGTARPVALKIAS